MRWYRAPRMVISPDLAWQPWSATQLGKVLPEGGGSTVGLWIHAGEEPPAGPPYAPLGALPPSPRFDVDSLSEKIRNIRAQLSLAEQDLGASVAEKFWHSR